MESGFWRLVRNPWVTTTVRVFLLVFVVVLGTDATVRARHLEPALDPVSYGLLAVMGAATVLRRWPLAAFGAALAATLAFLLLGHPGQGPYVLGVMVALYYTVSADRPWRSVALGALIVASSLAAGAIVSGYQTVPESAISALAAVVVPLGIGHAVASRRAWTRRTREEEMQHRVIEERLRMTSSAHPLSPGIDLIAYRIVQESLTNVLRHAGPATVEVKVSYEGGRIVIEVADDGQGIEAPTNGHRSGPGHGIAGMRERAAAVGGELEAGPRPIRGFGVRACLPYA